MKNIKRILICLLVTLLTTFNVQAEVKEDANNYTEDIYIIGSTRFTSDYTITSSRAATAGADEVLVQYNVFGNFGYRGNNIKTYYYCATDESWNEIDANGSGVKELTDEEMQKVVQNLDIFYINNVEKTLEIPFTDPVDEDSIIGPNDSKATVENGKILVPATWINGFAFTSEGANVLIEMGLGEEKGTLDEYDKPIIRMDAKLKITLPSNAQGGENFEFSLNIRANGNDGVNVNTLGVFSSSKEGNVIDSLEYYNENTSSWQSINNIGEAFGNKLQDVTIKYRAHLLDTISGNVKLNVSLTTSDNKSFTANAEMKVMASDVVVTVNDKEYSDLSLAFKENNEGTFKLVKDTNVDAPIVLNNGEVTLDLNGKTLNFAQKGAKLRVGSNTNLTVKNGTVNGKDYALQAEDNGTLTVNNDVNIVLDDTSIVKNKYGITIWDSATVNFEGNIIVTGDSIGISGNGDDKTIHSNVNITGGSIKVEEGVGIYQPNYGNTKISGGKITAGTVINIKAGSLDISDGEFNAIGEKVNPNATTGKTNPTGDVIIIEENTNYADNIKVNITGGTLTSKNGYMIQEYNPTLGTNNELTSVITGKYTTKHNISEDGITSYYDDKKVDFTVTSNNKTDSYSSEDLVNIAKNLKEGTITLSDNLDIQKLLFTGKVVLDLNGKTLNIIEKSKAIISDANAKLTIKNGTIKTVQYALQVEDDATLTVESDVNIVVNTLQDLTGYGVTMWENGVLNFNGNIKVTSGIGISGNGNNKTYNAKLNVNGGAITVEDGVGIYLPHYGTTKMSDGVITAGTGINIKAGSLEITGGTINATGEKVNPNATTGKTNETGDAIIIEENTNYADNIKVNITGGTLTSKNGYMIQEYNPTLGTNNILTSIVTGKYTTKHIISRNDGVETSYYDDKEAGVSVTENGITNNYDSSDLFTLLNNVDNVKLLKDAETNEAITLNTKKVTLDLNGKTLSFTAAGSKLRIRYNTDLTVKNGTIKGMDYTLQPEDDSTLTVENDVNIILDDKSITKNKYGIAYWDKSTVNFKGNIIVTGDSIGISGNGGVSNTGKLNITGGSITANEGAGLYLPNDGTTKISGGKITAGTVLNIKAGSLDISDGTFKATGEKVNPSVSNGKNNNTGDVIIIEENPSYQDHIKLNIVGGTFESVNGYMIQEYNPTLGTDNELTSVITGKYIKQNKINDNTFYYTEE